MSAGAFTATKYELDGGTIVNVKVQPETLSFTDGTAANDPPAGAVSLGISAYTRKAKNRYGVGCRLVRLTWNSGPPAGYKDESVLVPILQKSVFDGYSQGDTVTYLATAATITRKISEVLT